MALHYLLTPASYERYIAVSSYGRISPYHLQGMVGMLGMCSITEPDTNGVPLPERSAEKGQD